MIRKAAAPCPAAGISGAGPSSWLCAEAPGADGNDVPGVIPPLSAAAALSAAAVASGAGVGAAGSAGPTGVELFSCGSVCGVGASGTLCGVGAAGSVFCAFAAPAVAAIASAKPLTQISCLPNLIRTPLSRFRAACCAQRLRPNRALLRLPAPGHRCIAEGPLLVALGRGCSMSDAPACLFVVQTVSSVAKTRHIVV